MTSVKYEEVWKLLDRYSFDIGPNIPNDLICIICKEIMRNAIQGVCGCRYCLACIDNYLDGGEKCCPGEMDDCKDYRISKTSGFSFDNAINKKISQIKVKCPETFCQFFDELMKLATHIESHEFECPYQNMGCCIARINMLSMGDHLIRGSHDHAKLLVDFTHNLKNEIGCINQSSLKSEASLRDLAAKVDVLERRIRTIIQENGETQTRTEALQRECLQNRDSIRQLEQQIRNRGQADSGMDRNIREIQENNRALSDELVTLRDTIVEQGATQIKLEEQLKKINEGKTSSKQNAAVKHQPTEMIVRQVLGGEINAVPQGQTSFEWKIDDFGSKVNYAKNGTDKTIYSSPFYSPDGYRIRLRIDPCTEKSGKQYFLFVAFGLMKGRFDNRLLWPMKHQVTIDLMNQKTGKPFVSYSYQYDSVQDDHKTAFNRPLVRFDMNYDLGHKKFMSTGVLMNNLKVHRDGAILLKCSVL